MRPGSVVAGAGSAASHSSWEPTTTDPTSSRPERQKSASASFQASRIVPARQRRRVRGEQAVLHGEEARRAPRPGARGAQRQVVAGRQDAGDRRPVLGDEVRRVAGRLGPRTLRQQVGDAGRGHDGDVGGVEVAQRLEQGAHRGGGARLEADQHPRRGPAAGQHRVPAWPSGRAMSRSTRASAGPGARTAGCVLPAVPGREVAGEGQAVHSASRTGARWTKVCRRGCRRARRRAGRRPRRGRRAPGGTGRAARPVSRRRRRSTPGS